MEENNEKGKRIFNFYQASVMLRNGCSVIDCGIGDKGKVYLVFKNDLRFNEIMKRWLAKEFS